MKRLVALCSFLEGSGAAVAARILSLVVGFCLVAPLEDDCCALRASAAAGLWCGNGGAPLQGTTESKEACNSCRAGTESSGTFDAFTETLCHVKDPDKVIKCMDA